MLTKKKKRKYLREPPKAKIPTRAKCQPGQQPVNCPCPDRAKSWNNAWQCPLILLPEPLSSYGNSEGSLKEHCNWAILLIVCPGIGLGYHLKVRAGNILDLETWLLAPNRFQTFKNNLCMFHILTLETFTKRGLSKRLEENQFRKKVVCGSWYLGIGLPWSSFLVFQKLDLNPWK